MIRWWTTNLRRARQHSLTSVIRAILLRIWPLSILARCYYRIKFSAVGYSILNRDARLAFERHKVPLDPTQERALAELRHTGIFITHVEELVTDQTLFERLQEEAQRLLSEPDIQRQIKERQSKLLPKWYVVRAFGLPPTTGLPEGVVEMFLGRRLLDITNEYVDLCCRLRYIDLWYNFPVNA